ncbi:hypothetical protein Clacol_000253 [Clathrus columnatus]|uniref:RRM domain-containing protein n=1 Tax=Clathrus columnatus TaxID=1419009 RepID=A0AAV4ZZB5_9AGAM|nr:hypothetical protein Clacol_000253 [Clathrus columnatus]
MACGELKGIFIRFHKEHGIIILAFFDLRHSIRAHRQISTSPLFNGIRLHPRFISSSELRAWIGESNFVNQNDGEILISISLVGPNNDFNPSALQNILASFGDLHYFRCLNDNGNSFHVEYFDARDSVSALNALNGRTIHGVRLHINLHDTVIPSTTLPSFIPASPNRAVDSHVFAFPSKLNSHKREAFSDIPFPSKEASSDEGNGQPLQHLFPASRPTLHHSISEQNIRGRPRSRSASASPSPVRQQEQYQSILSAYDYFNHHHHFPHEDPMSSHPRVRTPPHHVRGRRISNIYHFDSVGRTMLELPPTAPPRPRSISVSSETDSPVAGRLAIPLPAGPVEEVLPELTAIAADVKREHALNSSSQLEWPTSDSEPLFNTNSSAVSSQLQSTTHRPALQLQIPRRYLISRHQRTGANGTSGYEVSGEKEKDTQPERNKIDIAKIERGEETRTTVMIKNIPNKMTDRNLIEFINQIPDPELGILINKTQMDQRAAWRPKLFHSSGPHQGLPEEFPAPTHTRRKERSSLLPHDLHQSRTLFHHISVISHN